MLQPLKNMICDVHPESGSQIRMLFLIGHPGSRGLKGTRSRIRNTAIINL